jgi:hypothetical protein
MRFSSWRRRDVLIADLTAALKTVQPGGKKLLVARLRRQ